MDVLRGALRLAGGFVLGVAVLVLGWLLVGVLGGYGWVGYVAGIALPAVAVIGFASWRWRLSWLTGAVVLGATVAGGYLALLTYALEHLVLIG